MRVCNCALSRRAPPSAALTASAANERRGLRCSFGWEGGYFLPRPGFGRGKVPPLRMSAGGRTLVWGMGNKYVKIKGRSYSFFWLLVHVLFHNWATFWTHHFIWNFYRWWKTKVVRKLNVQMDWWSFILKLSVNENQGMSESKLLSFGNLATVKNLYQFKK